MKCYELLEFDHDIVNLACKKKKSKNIDDISEKIKIIERKTKVKISSQINYLVATI